MQTIYDDIFIKIAKFLTDKEKITLTMSFKSADKLKHKFVYYEKIDIDTILSLPYFNNFKNINMSDLSHRCPKCAKHVFFDMNVSPGSFLKGKKDITHLTFGRFFNETIKDSIPLSVTHLTFGTDFNQPINNYIPSSVTHLTFGWFFNQSIDSISTSITHLVLDLFFSQSISKIPPSVTHLTLCIDGIQLDIIPPTVTHLTLIDYFNQNEIMDMPSSITHLTLGHNFNRQIPHLAPSITHLTLGIDFDQIIDNISSSVIEIKINKIYHKPICDSITSKVKIIRI